MIRNDEWNRCYVSLVSEGKPQLRDRDGENQEVQLWKVLNELGGERLTLDQIVKQCEYRRHSTSVSVRASVIWHLKNFANRKIVKIDFDV